MADTLTNCLMGICTTCVAITLMNIRSKCQRPIWTDAHRSTTAGRKIAELAGGSAEARRLDQLPSSIIFGCQAMARDSTAIPYMFSDTKRVIYVTHVTRDVSFKKDLENSDAVIS